MKLTPLKVAAPAGSDDFSKGKSNMQLIPAARGFLTERLSVGTGKRATGRIAGDVTARALSLSQDATPTTRQKPKFGAVVMG